MNYIHRITLIALTCLITVVFMSDADAINYGTNNSRTLQNMIGSGSETIATASDYLDGSDAVWYYVHASGDNNYYTKSMGCLPVYSGSTAHISFMNNQGNGFVGEVVYYIQDMKLISDITESNGNHYNSGVILNDFSAKTSSGAFPNEFVVCLDLSFIVHYPSTPGVYFYSQHSFIYNNANGAIIKDAFFGTGFLNPDGLKVNGTTGYSPKYTNGAFRYDFPEELSFSDAENTRLSDLRLNYFSQFFTGITQDTFDIHNPLGYYYGSNGYTTTLNEGSGSNSGSGTDYFADCTSFLDVGCYIKGVTSKISDFVVALFPNISWSGQSNTCVDITSTGALTSSISYTGSSVYIQNIVNLFSLMMPLPPPDNSNVCLIGGGDLWDDIVGSSGGIIQVHYAKYVTNQARLHGIGIDVINLFILILVAFAWLHILKPNNNQP